MVSVGTFVIVYGTRPMGHNSVVAEILGAIVSDSGRGPLVLLAPERPVVALAAKSAALPGPYRFDKSRTRLAPHR